MEIGFRIDAEDEFFWPPCVVVAQQVPLSRGLSVLGHRVFEAGWRFSPDRRGPIISNTEVGSLRVPRVAAGLGTEFIDLLCHGHGSSISGLVIKVDGELADFRRSTFGCYCGCRVLVPRPTAATDFGYWQVTFENPAPTDAIELVEILVRTVIGDLLDGERILSARPWGILENRPRASAEGESGNIQRALASVRGGQAVEPLDLQHIAQMVERGRTPRTSNASDACLRQIIASNAGVDCSDIATQDLLALVNVRRREDIRRIMVVSPALTVKGIDRQGRVRRGGMVPAQDLRADRGYSIDGVWPRRSGLRSHFPRWTMLSPVIWLLGCGILSTRRRWLGAPFSLDGAQLGFRDNLADWFDLASALRH